MKSSARVANQTLIKIRWIARAAALTVVLMSTAFLCIWIFAPSLKQFSAASMKANTALGLLLSGVALLIFDIWRNTVVARRLVLVIGILVASLGLVTFGEYVFGFHAGIDEWIATDFPSAESSLFPGRMSPLAAVALILSGLSLLVVRGNSGRSAKLASIFSIPLFLLAELALIGYLYGEKNLYQVGPYIRISWQSALCLLLIAIGLFCVRPKSQPIALLTSPELGGLAARRLLPIVKFVPLLLGLLWLEGRRRDIVSREFGISLMVLAIVLIFIAVVYWLSQKLNQLDRDRKRASRHLESTNEKLSEAIRAARVGFFDWKMGTTEMSFSEQMQSDWDVPARTTPQNALLRVHADDRENVRLLARAALASRGHFSAVFRVAKESGLIVWIEAEGDFSGDENGRPSRFFGSSIDITKMKQNEIDAIDARLEAEKANSAKSAFLANMSHEIRTPLGAIIGFTDLIRREQPSPSELLNLTSIVQRNSEHLLRVIDDILDLSKVEAGKMQIEKISFSISELIGDFISLMRPRALDKGIDLQFEALTQIPNWMVSDPTRIRQILTNVVGNAIKFTDRGSVTMTVRYDEPRLSFRVTDTGIGISNEQSRQLFQAFQQADVSTTRKYGGTGLGLVLTQTLARAMGGDFHLIKSELNSGSIFEATIRAEPAIDAKLVELKPIENALTSPAAASAASSAASAVTSEPPLRNLKVLIVDDSLDNQTLLKLILTKAGAAADVADNGQSGVRLALEGSYDVILMDIQMPMMDGHEATRLLRAKGYVKPIIALTAHAMQDERFKAEASGFTSFLTKPVQRSLVLESISRFGRQL